MAAKWHQHILAKTAFAVLAVINLSACDNILFGSADGYRMGKYACASKASQSAVKTTFFNMARDSNAAAADKITRIEQGAVATLEQPVVDAIEKETEKTLCSATLVLSLPPGSKTDLGVDENQKIPVRFSVQATADRKGSVYQLYGVDALVSKLSGKKAVDAQAALLAPAKPASSPAKQATGTGTYHYIRGLNPNGDNWLALRPEPSMAGQRLAKLGPETLLISDGTRVGIWLKVETLDGRKGWVASRYTACCK